MGYTTDFYGVFELNKPLKKHHTKYLWAFNNTRRVKRNAELVSTLPDPIREAVGLPVGIEGEFYVGGVMPTPLPNSSELYEGKGQFNDESVLDGNSPPSTQPGLWCQWTPLSPNYEPAPYDWSRKCEKTIDKWLDKHKDIFYIGWDGGEKFYNFVEWLDYIIANFLEPWGYKINGDIEWEGEEREDRGVILAEDNHISVGYVKQEYDWVRK